MPAMWKWFARSEDGYEPAECDRVDETIDTEAGDSLPAHVLEFLAMKAAAGV